MAAKKRKKAAKKAGKSTAAKAGKRKGGRRKAAKKAGYNADDCALAIAEAQRTMGKPQEALATLDQLFGAVEEHLTAGAYR